MPTQTYRARKTKSWLHPAQNDCFFNCSLDCNIPVQSRQNLISPAKLHPLFFLNIPNTVLPLDIHQLLTSSRLQQNIACSNFQSIGLAILTTNTWNCYSGNCWTFSKRFLVMYFQQSVLFLYILVARQALLSEQIYKSMFARKYYLVSSKNFALIRAYNIT